MDWRQFLSRPALPPPSPAVLNLPAGHTILITGAGGSIGSALALRLGALNLAGLVLLEASESNIYTLQHDLTEAAASSPTPLCPSTMILGSAGDRSLLEEIFENHAPRLVFHAAAFKHVPLMEEQPLAAIANNIFATEILVEAAAAHGARTILLSTDKAVEPASVMGATKRVAEEIVLASRGTVLRLGNVLASRDSVAEIFARQIEKGGPLTVTDPAARRYFLTVDEAVNLLLSAALYAEPAAVLAPSLPAPHYVVDLARFMALALRPECEIPIHFTGSRPGDKETERLWSSSDRAVATSFADLVSIETARPTKAPFEQSLARLRAALDARAPAAALDALQALVPDYTPSATVLELARRSRMRVCP